MTDQIPLKAVRSGDEVVAIGEFESGDTIGATYISGFRERLTADRTYYIRTDGSDTNNGLTNSSAGAFLTIQKAVDVVCGQIDAGEYQVTIQLGSGTYSLSSQVTFYRALGAKAPILKGDETTPSNVVVFSESAISLFVFSYGAEWVISGIQIGGPQVYFSIYAPYGGAYVGIKALRFDAVASTGTHIFAMNGSIVEILGSYTITGGARFHWNASQNAIIFSVGARTITLTGTPAFGLAFVKAQTAVIRPFSITFSGAATGPRYLVQALGSINTNAAGETYLPGNAAGTLETGGIYV